MRALTRVGMVAASAALALGVGSGVANADTTAPGYEQFAGCPNAPATVFTCIRTVIDGGHLKLGSTDTPIQAPIELNGGIDFFNDQVVFSSTGGQTSPRQRVPGGLTGLTGFTWLEDLVPLDLLKVYARAILVGSPSNPLGDPFNLDLKIKLENPLLSDTCYIGSNSNPIHLHLTQGTTSPPAPNTPISGVTPAFTDDPVLANVTDLTGGKLVDNAFSVPKATGCTMLLPGTGLIDPIVNLRSGLPSAAGNNTAEFLIHGAIADAATVYP
jgi:hypothetical protein